MLTSISAWNRSSAKYLYINLTEEEAAQYRRGRNAHVHMIPKNATHREYAMATGLECLFGYLYLSGQTGRINELFQLTMEDPHAD